MRTSRTRDTRQRILKAAVAVFGRAGYWNAAMDDVALAAGVAKGTVYLHFPSKEALFLAVVENILDELARRMEEDVRDMPLRERIRSKIGIYLSFFEEHAACFHAVTQERPGLTGRFAEIFWKKFMEKCGLIEEDIRRDIAAGEIRPVEPRDLLFSLVGMMHGTIHRWFLSGRSYRLAEKADGIADIVYRGIRSEP